MPRFLIFAKSFSIFSQNKDFCLCFTNNETKIVNFGKEWKLGHPYEMKKCRGGQNRALCISLTSWHAMRPVHVLSSISIYFTLIRSHGWVRTSIICIRPYFHLPYNFSFHKDVQIFTPQWGHCSDFSHFWGNVSWFFCLQYFEKLYMVHWYMDRHLQNIPIWLFFVTRVPP